MSIHITVTGLAQASGANWKAQRAFTHGVFRHFGVGRSLFETEICAELELLFKKIEDKNGESFDPTDLVRAAILNITSSLTLARKYKDDEEAFHRLVHSTDVIMSLIGSAGTDLMLKSLRPYESKADKMLKSAKAEYFGMITDNIKRRQKEYDPESVPKCLVDVYLKRIHEKEDLGPYINIETIGLLIGALFIAGSDTSSFQILWVLIYLISNPKDLNNVKQEIDKVVGRDRLPTMDDQAYLPYTQAVINECMRLSAPLPMGVMHASSDDTTLCGYTIPKGTLLLSNIWGIHHDPDTFAKPYHFDPSRFLDSKGQLVEDDNVIPFSLGMY